MRQELADKITLYTKEQISKNPYYQSLNNDLYNQIIQDALENKIPEVSLIHNLTIEPDGKVAQFLRQLFFRNEIEDIKELFNVHNNFTFHFLKFVSFQLSINKPINEASKLLASTYISTIGNLEDFEKIKLLGYSETEICELVLGANNNHIYADNEVNILNFAGELFQLVCNSILKNNDKSTFLNKLVGNKGANSEEELLKFLLNLKSNTVHHYQASHFELIKFIIENYPSIFKKNATKFLIRDETSYNVNQKTTNLNTLLSLIQNYKLQFENEIVAALNEVNQDYTNTLKITVYFALANESAKYNDSVLNEAAILFNNDSFVYDSYINFYNQKFSYLYLQFLKNLDENTFEQKVNEFLQSKNVLVGMIDYVATHFETNKKLDALFLALKDNVTNEVQTTIFKYLKKENLTTHFQHIEDAISKSSTKNIRLGLIELLLSYPNEAFDYGKKFLAAKTAQLRLAGAIILANLNTDLSITCLKNAVDTESNDDTRDVILEALSENNTEVADFETVKNNIQKADERKKLSKWSEKNIEESQIPALYWNNGEKLTEEEQRYIFYRMKRASGINSDIEAKYVFNHLDKTRSTDFAKFMLKAFQSANADTKLKYYLTIAGILGGDDMMHMLNSLFSKCIAEKRMKMAEYTIGALAMVGSNKALRLVEVIYRKFATKKPAISEAAKNALEAAANELNISRDELSDRIIPDFGFEGIYKHFEVDNTPHRAFISSEFKVNFIDEDNKIKKTVPKNCNKELKDEFKEIEKEIKTIVKAQDPRLLKYMLEQRKWKVADWKKFFQENPVMFIYAIKLIWGIFDTEGNLIDVFYCSEDTCLYNSDDEEIELEEDGFVGIIHPIYLSELQIEKWKDKLYDLGINTIFPQLDRKVFLIPENELKNTNTSMFDGKEVPKGADFVNNFLPKFNWLKSTGDGGSTEFRKFYNDGEFVAYANIEGPMAFFSGGNSKATVHKIYFGDKKSYNNVQLQQLPPIFFSEVMYDLEQMLSAN